MSRSLISVFDIGKSKMIKKVLIIFMTTVAVMLTAGCRRLDPVSQTSDLDLVFSTDGLETKAVTWEMSETASLQNGGLFSNLFVILVNGSTVYWEEKTISPDSKGVVRFRNIKNKTAGGEEITYQVYAFANYNLEGSHWGASKMEIAQELANDNNVLSESSGKLVINEDPTAIIASGVEALLTTDATKKGAMLLTGRGTVALNGSSVKINGSTSGTITLKRPFVYLTVKVQNPTGRPVLLDQLSFSAFSPAKTFLFDRQNSSGVPDVPSSPDYQGFSAKYPTSSVVVNSTEYLPAVPWTGNKNIYTTYLFESVAEEYKMYGHVIMYNPTSEAVENDLYLGTGPLPDGEDADDFIGDGSILKKLVNQMPEPITHLNRNQAFGIILNIYYGSSTGDLGFSVISDWVGDGEGEDIGGKHTFN